MKHFQKVKSKDNVVFFFFLNNVVFTLYPLILKVLHFFFFKFKVHCIPYTMHFEFKKGKMEHFQKVKSKDYVIYNKKKVKEKNTLDPKKTVQIL